MAGMTTPEIDANRRNWDERVAAHVVAYRAEEFADDPSAISSVVRRDVELLGPHLPGGSPSGLRLAHLQCHIGTDTLSWARLGAHVTGIDFSGDALAAARSLTARAGLAAEWAHVAADDERGAVAATGGEPFDVVYTSVGVLPWLPDLDAWARTIRALLRPDGVFFLRETHPFVAALDGERADELVVTSSYLATGTPERYDDGITYASDAIMTNAMTYEWQHPLSEIIGSLLHAGLTIEAFDEYDTCAWSAHPSLVPEGGLWVLPERRARLPLEFSLVARRQT
jgi:2-polyprenyl-3-methyl-5-hydroxy-6-metoxy-1,4-benzoquinol methylase